MDNLRGKTYLQALLTSKRTRILKRYGFYNSKDKKWAPSFVIPDDMKAAFAACLGWCGKSVDAMVTRMIYNGVEKDNFKLGEIFQMNNPSMFFRSGIQSALVGACAFVYISADEDGYPRLQVIDAGNATGRLNPITGFLYEGYAVLERDDQGNVITDAYFTPETTQFKSAGKLSTQIRNESGHTLLVPLIYRPDAERPFGHSRISRPCMQLQESAKAVLTRTDVTAEFYSFPQKYILGLAQNAEFDDKWKLAMSSFLQFTKDDDGDRPVIGQFAQASMQPHLDHMKQLAALFAGETGLTLDDLGFVSAAPSSSQAIESSHETLVRTIEDAMTTLGSGFLNAGFVAACLRDKTAYNRKALYESQIKWKPIVKADASTLSMLGDGAIKVNQTVPGYFDKRSLEDLTGIKAAAE